LLVQRTVRGTTARRATTSADEKIKFQEILLYSCIAAFVTGIVVSAAATRDLNGM